MIHILLILVGFALLISLGSIICWNLLIFWIIFLVVVIDLAVIFVVWLGVNGTMFLMYFATLA